MGSDSIITDALKIASRDLRWCYRTRGIISGSRLVYWSWDSFFASLGAMCLGDAHVVKKNLELYLSLQNEWGSIPKRIAHPWYWVKFLGIPIRENPNKQRPTFWNTYYTAPSITQNPTFIIALHAYVVGCDDPNFFIEHQYQVEKVMEYLESQEGEYGLLKEGIGGGWAESVLKRGAIAFTNVCYARAAFCLADLYTKQGSPEQAAHFAAKYKMLKDMINVVLWDDEDGGYYSDWYDHRRHHHFATDGNLLAVLWDIADDDKARKIQAKIDELDLEADIPIRLAYDKYHFWRVYFFLRLGGMQDYHVGFCWSWLGCIDAMVKDKLGYHQEAVEILERIATVIVRDGTVHEIYDKGNPVHTYFYKSEHPWAWGAGLFIAACYRIGYKTE